MARQLFMPCPYKGDLIRGNTFEVILGQPIGISTSAMEGLYMLCNKFTLSLPKSHAIPVPWMSGIMQLAGRQESPFSFSVSFLAGNPNGASWDTLTALQEWRNLCFDHQTGRIGLAKEYKVQACIRIMDTTYETALYEYFAEGVWPQAISDLNLHVDNNDIMNLECTFSADKIYLNRNHTRLYTTKAIKNFSYKQPTDKTYDTSVAGYDGADTSTTTYTG